MFVLSFNEIISYKEALLLLLLNALRSSLSLHGYSNFTYCFVVVVIIKDTIDYICGQFYVLKCGGILTCVFIILIIIIIAVSYSSCCCYYHCLFVRNNK